MGEQGLVQKHKEARVGMKSGKEIEGKEREESMVKAQRIRLTAQLTLEETDYKKQCEPEGQTYAVHRERAVCRWLHRPRPR